MVSDEGKTKMIFGEDKSIKEKSGSSGEQIMIKKNLGVLISG